MWKTTTLGASCKMYQPKTISKKEMRDDGKYFVYGANGIIGKFDKYNHTKSQLLLTCRGATCGTVNVSHPNSWINGNAMVIQPDCNLLSFRFMEHLLKNGIDFSKIITGSAQPQITRQSLNSVIFSYPTLEQQQEIVDLLDVSFDEIDKASDVNLKLSNLTKKIQEAIYKSLIKKNNVIKKVKLGEICTIKGRIGYRGYTKKDITSKGKGAISLSPSNIENNKLVFSKTTYISWDKYEESPEIMIYPNDIIFCKTGSTYGKTAYVENLPEKATLNPQLVVLKNIKCDTKFLYYSMLSSNFKFQIEEIISGSALPTLSQKDLSETQILLPPENIQKNIVSKIDKITKYSNDIHYISNLKIEKFLSLKKKIIQKALIIK